MRIAGKVKKTIRKTIRANGLAEVELTLDQIEKLHLVNAGRATDPENERYWRLVRAMRREGYASAEPLRIFFTGERFVLVDGGHRLNAARRVAREWLVNLFAEKVTTIPCLVTPDPALAAAAANDAAPDRRSD